MLFKKLTLINFGPFKGEHTLDLDIRDNDRKIILIGALNGSGKTTIHEAIQIVLFGKLSAPAKRFKKGSYDNFLESFINSGAASENGSEIILDFTFSEDGEESNYKISRRWRKKKSKVEEQLDVFVNNVRDALAAEMWNERIQDIFPPRIASLFFFDGEQIEELADMEKLSSTLREAMYSLLGLDLVEQLTIDLQILKKSKVQKIEKKDVSSAASIQSLEEQIFEFQSIIAERQCNIDELSRELTLRKESIQEKHDEFEEIGGVIFEQHSLLQNNLKNLELRKQKLLNDQRELAEGSLPFAFIKNNLLRNLYSIISQKAEQQKEQELLNSFVLRDQEIMDKLTQSKANLSVIQLLEKLFKDDLEQRLLQTNLSSISDIDLKVELKALDHLFSDLQSSLREAKVNETEIQSLDLELIDIHRKLSALPSEDRVAKIKGELESLQYDKARLETLIQREVEALGSTKYQLQQRKIQLSNVIETALTEQAETSELSRLNDTIEWSSCLLHEFKAKIVSHNIEKIEYLALQNLNQLFRKKTFIKNLQIDAETFELTLYDGYDSTLDVDTLSAGERQIIATSIIWALSQASSICYPTVIDTPLGRLDSSHRKALCSGYFPNASNQVILLSTDEEIIGPYYSIIDDHCSNRLTLRYDGETRSSQIEAGYFVEKVA